MADELPTQSFGADGEKYRVFSCDIQRCKNNSNKALFGDRLLRKQLHKMHFMNVK